MTGIELTKELLRIRPDLPVMLRPCIILPQGIYPELMRDTTIALQGASIYGTIPIGKGGSLEYQAITGVLNVDKDSGYAKFLMLQRVVL